MSTIEEAKYILRRLPIEDRHAIAGWLEGFQEETEFVGVRDPAIQYAEELPYMTLEEYLKFEETSPSRHEYVNGYVHAMAGASVAHNRIVSRFHVAVAKRLEGGPCETFTSDLKLLIDTASDQKVLYPDIMVSCSREGWRGHWLHNPRLIVEVQSPSTQHIDRREKAATYRNIPSVEEYVIATQSRCHLTIFGRAENWVPEIVRGPEEVAEFRSLNIAVPLAEIYRGVFPESAAADGSGPE
jgi:Uma2 family endonuclease